MKSYQVIHCTKSSITGSKFSLMNCLLIARLIAFDRETEYELQTPGITVDSGDSRKVKFTH